MIYYFVVMSITPDMLFVDAVERYADGVAGNFRLPVDAQPEDQLKSLVSELVRQAGVSVGLDVSWRSEAHVHDVHGRPDLGFTSNGLLTGHIELKRPGYGARAERFRGRDGEQWRKFRALPNLIYTDGSEWSLYRSGELSGRVRIADDVSESGYKGVDFGRVSQLHHLLQGFLSWLPLAPGTAEGLAGFLAPLARLLRDEVGAALRRENSELSRLAKEWRHLLFPEGDDSQFSDAYAQTVTYALLLAHFEGADSLRPMIAADALQREHGLLSEAIQLLEASSVRAELSMPIELLERAIGAVDGAQILRGDDDPWLYFYEHFLGAYDPKLRKSRGVYYTPVEVVRLQVRLAGELLRSRFNKPLSFADDDVVVLDPAVGTGTYPLAVIDHARDAVEGRQGVGAVAERLRGLADRLHAFEVLVGPYSVSHLRISQKFREVGLGDKAAKVYLTDTLESPYNPPEFTASIMQTQLTEERNRAQMVKKDTRVFVCIGNPPYDREEQDSYDQSIKGKGGWVRFGDEGSDSPAILEDFLKPAREAGHGKYLRNLYNDYVYFWRWALWKVFDSTGDSGIVTFITASSYLRGLAFSGMRRKMRETFDELWVIDLEGDGRGTRKTDNVFAIRTPMAIAIGIRDGEPKPDVPAKVWKTRLTGSEHEKLSVLDDAGSFGDFDWMLCSDEWDEPFYPAGTGSYFDWHRVTDVFPWQHSGVKVHRSWPIGETHNVLIARWNELIALDPDKRGDVFKQTSAKSGRIVNKGYDSLLDKDVREVAISEESNPIPRIESYAFRSLDRHWIIADARVGDRMRPELWRSHSAQQIYMTSLLTYVHGEGSAAIASEAVPDEAHFRGSFGGKHVIPLWRDSEATQPNITKGLLELLSNAYGLTVSAEDLFAYAYGVLAQPAYVERFWDELELPPPRLPITKDAGLFRRVSLHGAKLLYLHTYGRRFGDYLERHLANDDAADGASDPLGGSYKHGAVPQGSARCIKSVSAVEYPKDFGYDAATEVLRVGDGEFAPVSPEVYGYSVSGLQVVKSWLDYRKLNRSGRKSSRLDDIRPDRWEFAGELLDLLWVLERTVELEPCGVALLNEICGSSPRSLFSSVELPIPAADERKPPQGVGAKVMRQGKLG